MTLAQQIQEWLQDPHPICFVIKRGKKRVTFTPQELAGKSSTEIEALIESRFATHQESPPC